MQCIRIKEVLCHINIHELIRKLMTIADILIPQPECMVVKKKSWCYKAVCQAGVRLRDYSDASWLL